MKDLALGLCTWDLPAAILLILIIVVWILNAIRMKKKQKEYEDQLEDQIDISDLDL